MSNDLNQARTLIQECLKTKDIYLDIGNCGITDLDDLPELFECVHLETLIVSNKWYDIDNNKNIQSKNIGKENKLDVISNNIENLKNLKKLYLGGYISTWNISDISMLKHLNQLKTLNIGSNKISNLSFLKDYLTQLINLDLSNNYISSIDFLENMNKLESLNLSDNEISDYSILKSLNQLIVLDLSDNKISDTSFLKNLNQLKSLDLNYNKISDTSFLKKFKSLKVLDLSYNQISEINFLKDLNQLNSLDLSRNKKFNYSILKSLNNLKSLVLSRNNISDLSFLKNLTQLNSLVLTRNKIVDTSFLKNLIQLNSLDLSLNNISDLSFLKNLTQLNSLDLSNNEISKISFLKNLNQLTVLDLNLNLISNVGILKNLTQLKSLDLSDNEISKISFIKSLTQLNFIDLSFNQISKLQKWIINFTMEITFTKEGKGINLYKNPLKKPPPEIVEQGKESIRNWFNANKKELNEIKVILIGEPKAGKSSLLKRLKDNDFDENEEQTDGINIEDIHFGKNEFWKNQEEINQLTGHFWDFGGQEIMSATHQFFLTKRSVYVMVLDARTDTDVSGQIRKWVLRIKAAGSNSPIIVVANKIDINPGFGFENEAELKKEFPEIKCMITTSCSDGSNLELIKDELAKVIPQTELFHTEIDERWIEVKEKLQEETKEENFINETRFKEICIAEKLTNENEQKQAISFFHDLGLVLHFEEISKDLAEYYVLDPYWITYGVYQILTSKRAANQKGNVHIDTDLEFIINKEEDKEKIYRTKNSKKIEYSPNHRRFLVDILNQFKLCFYQANKESFIIPDLLETKEPSDKTSDFRNPNGKIIQFVYEYEYLPKIIMPQILVETHNMVEEMWRTGCILSYDNSKALISTYNNRIFIFVLGDQRKKKELLIIIRSLIGRINTKSSYTPTKLIPLPGLDNEYVEYKVLISREARGVEEYMYDEYLDTEKCFLIKDLLEGHPNEKLMTDPKTTALLNSIFKEVKQTNSGVQQIIHKLDTHYKYLITLPKNKDIKDLIIPAVQEISNDSKETILNEVLAMIATGFETHQDDMLNGMFNDIKNTDNWEMKIKTSIPLLNLIGIDIGVESDFDIKGWSEKLYEKYEVEIFKLFGKV